MMQPPKLKRPVPKYTEKQLWERYLGATEELLKFIKAEDIDTFLDLVDQRQQLMEMMQALRADGLGTADHSALACYYEKLAKVEVTR